MSYSSDFPPLVAWAMAALWSLQWPELKCTWDTNCTVIWIVQHRGRMTHVDALCKTTIAVTYRMQLFPLRVFPVSALIIHNTSTWYFCFEHRWLALIAACCVFSCALEPVTRWSNGYQSQVMSFPGYQLFRQYTQHHPATDTFRALIFPYCSLRCGHMNRIDQWATQQRLDHVCFNADKTYNAVLLDIFYVYLQMLCSSDVESEEI